MDGHAIFVEAKCAASRIDISLSNSLGVGPGQAFLRYGYCGLSAVLQRKFFVYTFFVPVFNWISENVIVQIFNLIALNK